MAATADSDWYTANIKTPQTYVKFWDVVSVALCEIPMHVTEVSILYMT